MGKSRKLLDGNSSSLVVDSPSLHCSPLTSPFLLLLLVLYTQTRTTGLDLSNFFFFKKNYIIFWFSGKEVIKRVIREGGNDGLAIFLRGI